MSRTLAGTGLTTRPSIDTVPDVIGSNPAIMRNTVDLPQPEGPSRTMNSRSATAKLTSLTAGATEPSYRLQRFSTATTATFAPCGPWDSPGFLADRSGGHPLDHGFGKDRVDDDDREDRDHQSGGDHPDVELVA